MGSTRTKPVFSGLAEVALTPEELKALLANSKPCSRGEVTRVFGWVPFWLQRAPSIRKSTHDGQPAFYGVQADGEPTWLYSSVQGPVGEANARPWGA